MYRTPTLSIARAGVSAGRAGRDAVALRFATIGVNQFCSSPWGKANIRPVFCRVAPFERRSNDPGRDELVKVAWPAALRLRAWRNQFGHYSAMRGNGDMFPGLDAPYEATQIVFQFANTSGSHK